MGEARPEYPQKKYFRSRAHCNPLSNNDGFEYPERPEVMDWSEYYEEEPSSSESSSSSSSEVKVVDVGCGFGGLCVRLSEVTSTKVLGLEIRPKVCEFVRRRIESARSQGECRNAAVLRSNAMLHLVHFVKRGQLDKLFFCFPDPHFKAKNHRRRVISDALLAEYAYLLKAGGLLFAVTDVFDLHQWHLAKLTAHPCFVLVSLPDTDPYLRAALDYTEEGIKVHRNNGSKFAVVARRLPPSQVDLAPDIFGGGATHPSSSHQQQPPASSSSPSSS